MQDPRDQEDLEVAVQLVLGAQRPRRIKVVIEILPDGTTAIGKEISDRTKQPGGK